MPESASPRSSDRTPARQCDVSRRSVGTSAGRSGGAAEDRTIAKHSLTDAAKLAGIARSTLYRHLETGRVSKEETPDGAVIDTAELIRAYGDLPGLAATSRPAEDATARDAPDPAPWEARIDALAATIEAAHIREREALEARLADLATDRDAWRAQAERQTLLLEKTTVPRVRSFLDRLRAR